MAYSLKECLIILKLTLRVFVCSEQVSARIVQEVTAEAVAVLKGEQETQRLPSGKPCNTHTHTHTYTHTLSLSLYLYREAGACLSFAFEMVHSGYMTDAELLQILKIFYIDDLYDL